jgi:hypothetical protein
VKTIHPILRKNMNSKNKTRICALVAGTAFAALAITSPMSASAATGGVVCNVSANLVGNSITPVGSITFPSGANQIVIGYDLAAAGNYHGSVDPVYAGPGSSYVFTSSDAINVVNLPALPATITVNWKFYTNFGQANQTGTNGSCGAVDVTDANVVTPTPPTPPTPPTDGPSVTPPAAKTDFTDHVQTAINGGLITSAVVASLLVGSVIMYRRRRA